MSPEVKINPERTVEVIQAIFDAERRGGFSPSHPEEALISKVGALSTPETGSLNTLHVLLALSPFTRGNYTIPLFRGTERRLNGSNLGTLLPTTTQLPNPVLITSLQKLIQPAGYSIKSLAAVAYNLNLLTKKYGGDIRNFFLTHHHNAPEIVKALEVAPRAKTAQKIRLGGFLGFGEKLAILYVQWVHQYQLEKLTDANKIGVPVDSHIAGILIQTECVVPTEATQVYHLNHRVILPLLKTTIQELGWEPHLVSNALWGVGVQYCNQARNQQPCGRESCPISTYCQGVLPRGKYDKGGKYDPADLRRFI